MVLNQVVEKTYNSRQSCQKRRQTKAVVSCQRLWFHLDNALHYGM